MLKTNKEIKEIAEAEVNRLIRSCDVNPMNVNNFIYESLTLGFELGYRKGMEDGRKNTTREG